GGRARATDEPSVHGTRVGGKPRARRRPRVPVAHRLAHATSQGRLAPFGMVAANVLSGPCGTAGPLRAPALPAQFAWGEVRKGAAPPSELLAAELLAGLRRSARGRRARRSGRIRHPYPLVGRAHPVALENVAPLREDDLAIDLGSLRLRVG